MYSLHKYVQITELHYTTVCLLFINTTLYKHNVFNYTTSAGRAVMLEYIWHLCAKQPNPHLSTDRLSLHY